MSTRSHIGIYKNGKVRYKYCHSDGYLSYVGNFLSLFYKDPEKVKKLINLGDMSCIGYNVEAPRKFEDFREASTISSYCSLHVKTSFCLAYHRDRGENWDDVKPETCGLKEYVFGVSGMIAYSYLYDWDKQKWYVVFGDGDGKIHRYDLDRLASDPTYFACFKSETQDYENYEHFVEIREDLKADFSKLPERSILSQYNGFLKEKKIDDVEIDYVSDGKGGRIWGLLKTVQPGEKRRHVITRSPCIGDCIKEALDSHGKSFYF